jgi:O-antigen ligase
VLLAGLIAPQSRGPWVGAAALILLLVLTGPSAAKGVARIAVLSLIGIAALAPTDFGQNLFLNTLSSIGEEDDTLSYRTRLFQVSIVIILENPFFGSYDFLSQMEEMRQGQGIIDLVNTFIAVSLSSGLVGLSLFIGCFLTAAFGIVRGMHRLESRESEHYRLGQALLAALVGTLIIISSTSSITVIPVIYWPLIGVGVAYARLVRGSPGVETGQGAAASGIGANSFPLATARASAPGRALL